MRMSCRRKSDATHQHRAPMKGSTELTSNQAVNSFVRISCGAMRLHARTASLMATVMAEP